mgnify:CR=1 FL=1
MHKCTPLRILVCPDSFKGSLDAMAVAEAMTRGVRTACPGAQVRALPMADGGEGTARLATETLGWAWQRTEVHGPRGECVTAGWGIDIDGRRAVIDVASACGLDLVPSDQRDPWRLDSRGVGELMLAAMDAGAEELMIGLGGSGTVDGGAGMLAALGARFLDAHGKALSPTPAALAALARVDLDGLDPRLDGTGIVVLNDVDNPLTGPQGAAAVFGPQKGLTEADIQAMDRHLARLAARLDAAGPLRCPADTPGAGAAGGLGFALACVLGGHSRMGATCLADLIDLDEAIASADLVITGEGQIDAQTARGKVVAEVITRATRLNVPVVAVAGRINATPAERAALGLTDARGLVDDAVGVEQAMAEPARWITERTRQLVETHLDRG